MQLGGEAHHQERSEAVRPRRPRRRGVHLGGALAPPHHGVPVRVPAPPRPRRVPSPPRSAFFSHDKYYYLVSEFIVGGEVRSRVPPHNGTRNALTPYNPSSSTASSSGPRTTRRTRATARRSSCGRWRTSTSGASCTATSSRRICSWPVRTTTRISSWLTLGSPSGSEARTRSRRCAGRPTTWRPRSSRACRAAGSTRGTWGAGLRPLLLLLLLRRNPRATPRYCY